MKSFKRLIRWELILPASLLFVFYIFSVSDIGDDFRQSAIAPLEFRFRSWVSKEPEKHKKLKIVIYGDRAKRELGIQELVPLATWQQVLTSLAERQPGAIYLDKFFSVYAGDSLDAEKFRKAIRGLNSPVIAAASLGIAPEKGLAPIETLFKEWSVAEDVRVPQGSQETLVGPHMDIADAFSGLGHIRVEDSTTAVEPAWKLSETQRILPQLSISAAKDVFLAREKIVVDGQEIPLDRHGRIPVNFLERKKIFSSSVSFLGLVNPETRARELEKIEAGDEVLVLPSMYAGSTDVRSSPLGLVEGGLYHASLLNSRIGDLFLQPLFQNSLTWFLVLLGTAAASAAAALVFSQRVSIALVIVGSLGLIFVGLCGFAWAQWLLDWHILFALFFTNGTLSALVRAILFERQSLRVSTALEGMVAPAVLETLKNSPELLMSRPRSLNVTLFFVDVEGFSLRTKNLESVDVFQILHAQLGMVADIVHQFGGVIDKNLGDGLLCYFGGNIAAPQGSAQQSPHQAARSALRCAVEIQRRAAALTARSPDARGALGPLLPLRIGVNSGEVFLGNLGTGRRVDFTIVGEAVNTAKRLEDACETFRILLGEETHQLLIAQGEMDFVDGVKWHKRKMSIKHQSELVYAWECDPFAQDAELYSVALSVLRFSAEQKPRNPIHATPYLQVKLCHGDTVVGQLVQFAQREFLIRTDEYFCRKVILQVRLVTESPEINAELDRRQLSIINFQVLSGRVLGEREFLHEVSPSNLSAERIDELSSLLLRSS